MNSFAASFLGFLFLRSLFLFVTAHCFQVTFYLAVVAGRVLVTTFICLVTFLSASVAGVGLVTVAVLAVRKIFRDMLLHLVNWLGRSPWQP